MITNKQKEKLISKMIKSKGFTLKLNLQEPKHKSGYYVSITNNKNRQISDFMFNKIAFQLKNFKNMPRFNNRELYLGFWKNGINKYLDVTLFCNKREIALMLGNEFKQLAIFDIKGSTSINLNDNLTKN